MLHYKNFHENTNNFCFLESKRQEVLTEVKRKRDDKKKVLEDQLNIIKAEKSKVDSDVQAMQHQVEVRNITKKISTSFML